MQPNQQPHVAAQPGDLLLQRMRHDCRPTRTLKFGLMDWDSAFRLHVRPRPMDARGASEFQLPAEPHRPLASGYCNPLPQFGIWRSAPQRQSTIGPLALVGQAGKVIWTSLAAFGTVR